MGQAMAEWIANGDPGLDLWKMDIRRFGAQYESTPYTLARTVEVYSTYYDIHYPNEERQAGRPLRTSPTYPRLKELDASFGEKSGWERPNWFEANAVAGEPPPEGWAGVHWSSAIAAEHRATRESVGLFDETSFAKLEVRGRQALDFLQRMCDNDLDRPPGTITYTQMLNRRGGIECDFTVTRLDEERFFIVTGTAFGNHDAAWIRRHMRDLPGVELEDVTSQFACLGLWGPSARDLLQPLTETDLGNDNFPYMSERQLTVGMVPCRALRVTYVGELGWELYCPMEYGLKLWDTLWEAGKQFGIVAGGYRAIDSMRLEKGYRVWSSDITPDDNPYEAGLGFAVRLNKEVDFIGKQALIRARAAGVNRRLRPLLLEDIDSIALGGEPVRVDGQVGGRVTSGGVGYTLKRSIAYAYVPVQAAVGTSVEVEVFGRWVPAVVSDEPLFDKKGERIKV
jgi:4-methylaminobutanoate oxidase (formaldehyde-forming)